MCALFGCVKQKICFQFLQSLHYLHLSQRFKRHLLSVSFFDPIFICVQVQMRAEGGDVGLRAYVSSPLHVFGGVEWSRLAERLSHVPPTIPLILANVAISIPAF